MTDIKLRISEPATGVLAFYAGRETETPARVTNWVEDGALSLGIASYAIVSGSQALVYDSHVSLASARQIRQHLEALGVTQFTLLLSHWHLDHVAGSEVFADCTIISNARTAQHLKTRLCAIEGAMLMGPPAISPLILPTQIFTGSLDLEIGHRKLHIFETDIHSDDQSLIWLAKDGLLLAGDAVEDTITYVDEPPHLSTHLANLDALWALNPARVLPCHGDPDVIAEGGYERTLIRATQQYIRMLRNAVTDERLRDMPLADFIRGPLEAGWVHLYAPYEDLHLKNMRAVLNAHAQ